MTRTLVAYASKRGSTEEVARAIGAHLREADAHVDIRAAAVVTDITPYDAVIVGGSLYMGRWNAEARGFMRRHRTELERRPLAVFALGPLSADAHLVAESQAQLTAALARLDIHPRFVTVFGGVVDPAKLRFPFNRMPKTDARSWPEIEAWAAHVSTRFSQLPHGEPV